MKSRLSSAMFVALLTVSLSSFAQENHVDISLKGPWILYVDHSFAKWPVLIAMAPGVDSDPMNHWGHQPPTVGNGDAYVMEDPQSDPSKASLIYCLTFDDVCAPKGTRFLRFYDYPNDASIRISLKVQYKIGYY